MNRQRNKQGTFELRASIVNDKMDVHFWYEGKAYQTISLFDSEEPAFAVGDNPTEESVNPWARLRIIENTQKGRKLFEVELHTNVISDERTLLELVARQANVAIALRQNTIFDLTDALRSIGWSIHPSNEHTP